MTMIICLYYIILNQQQDFRNVIVNSSLQLSVQLHAAVRVCWCMVRCQLMLISWCAYTQTSAAHTVVLSLYRTMFTWTLRMKRKSGTWYKRQRIMTCTVWFLIHICKWHFWYWWWRIVIVVCWMDVCSATTLIQYRQMLPQIQWTAFLQYWCLFVSVHVSARHVVALAVLGLGRSGAPWKWGYVISPLSQ